jgi:hypothetical protein
MKCYAEVDKCVRCCAAVLMKSVLASRDWVGLYKLTHKLESAWFQTLSL